MKNKIKLSLLGIFAVSQAMMAQDTLRISKNDLWQKASENNLQLKISNQEFKSAQADYRQSNSLFLPSISASHTVLTTTNPLMAFGSKLNQEILTASDFNPTLLNNPEVTQNYATKIEVVQPLINVDGIYGRQAAKAKMEAYQLQTERSKEYLQLELNKAFMQLQLAYKAVKVLEKANTTSEATLKYVENNFKQGYLQKTDVLSVQVRVNDVKNQLQYAKSNVQNASDYLAFLLQEEMTGKVYLPTEALENAIAVTSLTATLSDNRKDLQAMNKSSEAYRKMMQSGKMSFLPRLNAFGSYELYDTQLFGMGASGYVLGAQLSWSLFDGYKTIGKSQKVKADFQKSELDVKQYKAQSQLELNKTNRQLLDAENKVNLSRLAFEQSQEAQRIRKNRFTQGLEKTTDVLLSETQVAQKELEYLQAVFEYNFTQQYQQFLTQ
ncbi:outer membrane protein, RND efflux system precursor [Flavobacterium limnosediminis JC2902]|uniref:Outer membrane protein, RND efflux system n=1 Tax=Flavobacterium limnosediminis JC2902 TaxID=1341181 RepID=V6SJH8_9FLAO|nr:TolC family protein [Flavobacterium limnosediminis]ESU26417.1 outer membrane protein, RND efflux system precursor [Flavobacterium limnosediminis JC2902]